MRGVAAGNPRTPLYGLELLLIGIDRSQITAQSRGCAKGNKNRRHQDGRRHSRTAGKLVAGPIQQLQIHGTTSGLGNLALQWLIECKHSDPSMQ